MGIRVLHTHEGGRVCYSMGRDLSNAGVYRINGRDCIVAYKRYTCSWYCYDTLTGSVVATFDNKWFLEHVGPHKIADLTSDKNCVIA